MGYAHFMWVNIIKGRVLKMKKLLLALTLVLCLAASMVALTSCGGNGDECDHIWATTATTDTAATCTEEGSQSIKCLECGEKKADSVTAIPATGHEYTTDAYTAPTCIEGGSETKICAVCADTVTTTLDATGVHTWGDFPTVDVEATCTTDGQKSTKCTVCNEVKEGSVETIAATHIWGVIATADVNPTCTTEGIKTVKCILCSAKQEGTEETIPATGHSNVPVVVTPTFFSEGLAEGNCSACNETISYTLPKTEVIVNVSDSETKANTAPHYAMGIADAMNGKTFAPTEDNPNGNDLYLEFSILWNDTMANVNGSGIGWGHMANSSDVTIEGSSIVKAFSWLYYKNNPSNAWCPFAGGFEFSENVKEFVYGPAWRKNEANKPTTEADYTIIQGLDGWHRIGLQYHQNVYRSGNLFTYDVTVTVYVDGVKTNEMILNWGDFFYSATLIDGEVVYADNIDVESYYTVVYRIGNPHLDSGKTDAYFVFADCMLSVGDGFVLDVDPVANPEAKDFTVTEGVNLSGKMYYELATDSDADTTTPGGGATDSEDAETTTPANPGFGSASDAEDAG